MEKKFIEPEILEKANVWLNGEYDTKSKEAIKHMIDNDPQELIESFYRDLEFGTGGLRGIMGVGTNRMNKYTVGMATQGLANYALKMFPEVEQISAVIAYDCRNNNTFFAQITADVLTANGIKVYLFDELKPTPELSFAIRELKAQIGIMITASHNPKEYNGYKVYWDDGGQLINPHDINVVAEAQKVTDINEVNFLGNKSLQSEIGSEIDRRYLDALKTLSLSPEIIKKHHDIKIVYTPIHGTGVKLVPTALKEFGFTQVFNVPEQDVVSGDFETVISPNPEETAALKMAIDKAKEIGADLVMATDPDADRVGIAVRDDSNEFIILNGNQTAALLTHYLFTKWKENELLDGNQFMVKTIVTSELLIDMANKFGIDSYDVLTGFKFIADIIKQLEGKKTFIGGGEESYGFLVGDFVRDKDAVSACAMIAETAAWASDQGMKLYDLLKQIYLEYDFYYETLISVVKKGKAGAEEIQALMVSYRNNPPKIINNSEVISIKDYQKQIHFDLKNSIEQKIDLPKSNVLQFFTEDGSKISVRPSGTEPKIKYYFGVKSPLDKIEDFNVIYNQLKNKVNKIIASMELQ
ncbi:MAG: phospho-sugar mutase [Bacteroidales bacterium]|jgi:phosphoglucomutase|nr:phospho-sugar mutase [Bacteroidales bacterium]